MFWSIFLKTAQKRKKINHRQLVHVHVNTPQTMYYISNDKFCKRLKLRFCYSFCRLFTFVLRTSIEEDD